MATDPAPHFPADYRSARAAFLTACDAAGLGATARRHPGAAGPDGKDLYVDTAVAGDITAEKALLLISGTHGVEGYFGSGAETGLLHQGIAARVPEGAKLVAVHALNPYGFAWNRRVTEDNVDLNRNFVDYRAPPANPAYDELAEAIAPKDISPAAWKAANRRLRDFSQRHGAFALQEAISRGQYAHADGVYYGGVRETWSAAMLRDIVAEHLRGVRRLVVIDFHTGLGETGAAEMIVEAPPGSAHYERAKRLWGQRVRSPAAGDSLSAQLTGTIDTALVGLAGEAEVTVGALEVGTRSLRDVFDALRRDNWLHAFAGIDHPDAPAIKKRIRDAFYPDTPEWKRAVFAAAEESVLAALAALGASA